MPWHAPPAAFASSSAVLVRASAELLQLLLLFLLHLCLLFRFCSLLLLPVSVFAAASDIPDPVSAAVVESAAGVSAPVADSRSSLPSRTSRPVRVRMRVCRIIGLARIVDSGRLVFNGPGSPALLPPCTSFTCGVPGLAGGATLTCAIACGLRRLQLSRLRHGKRLTLIFLNGRLPCRERRRGGGGGVVFATTARF